MENTENEQIKETTHIAGANMELGGDSTVISLGKFKDTNALLNAYNSLQAEFTKRCQRIKELEGEVAKKEENLAMEVEKNKEKEEMTEKEKEQILKSYLQNILSSKSKAVVMEGNGGGILRTPDEKPKSIREAGDFVKEMFKK